MAPEKTDPCDSITMVMVIMAFICPPIFYVIGKEPVIIAFSGIIMSLGYIGAMLVVASIMYCVTVTYERCMPKTQSKETLEV